MGAPQAMIRAAILTFMTFALPAWAETVDGNRITVLDGDTVALPRAKQFAGCAEKISFVDIDAPETCHPDCDEGMKPGCGDFGGDGRRLPRRLSSPPKSP